MFSRLFNQSLPAPSEEQQQTILKELSLSLPSEVVSAAYEPRFQLTALGTSSGDLFVINKHNVCFSHAPENSTQKLPILKIIPLINSSTFFSVCSQSMFDYHLSLASMKKEPKTSLQSQQQTQQLQQQQQTQQQQIDDSSLPKEDDKNIDSPSKKKGSKSKRKSDAKGDKKSKKSRKSDAKKEDNDQKDNKGDKNETNSNEMVNDNTTPTTTTATSAATNPPTTNTSNDANIKENENLSFMENMCTCVNEVKLMETRVKKLKGLSDYKRSLINNQLSHWIVTPTGILQRAVLLSKFDILDFAVSPIHPEFVLLLMKNGALHGFSVEEMKFTELYIDVFEGKPVRCIACPFGMSFYIAHDAVEKLDIVSKEISKGQNSVRAQSMDVVDDFSSVIDTNGSPKFLKGSKIISSIDLINTNKKGIHSSIITEKDWVSIVRSTCNNNIDNNINNNNNNENVEVNDDFGDSVYLNGKLKFGLSGDYLIPSTLFVYNNPYQRQECKQVSFVTDFGRTVAMNGRTVDHFITSNVNPIAAFIEPSELRFYLLSSYIEKDISNNKNNAIQEFLVFESKSFVGKFNASSIDIGHSVVLAVVNYTALCIENSGKDICFVDIKKNEKTKLLSINILSTQIFPNRIDLICETGLLLRFDLTKEKLEMEEKESPYPSNFPLSSIENKKNAENDNKSDCKDKNKDKNENNNEVEKVKKWRPFYDTIAYVSSVEKTGSSKKGKKKDSNKERKIRDYLFLLSENKLNTKICKKSEKLILFEVINEKGEIADILNPTTPPNSTNDANTTNNNGIEKGFFILIVTTKSVSIYVAEKLKRVRHVPINSNSPIVEATITDWGVLIVRTNDFVQMITLPDPSFAPIAKLPLDIGKANAGLLSSILLPHKGLVVVEDQINSTQSQNSAETVIIDNSLTVSIYLRDITLSNIYLADEYPPIPIPQATGMKKLFAKKIATLEDADQSFQFKRENLAASNNNSNNNNPSSSIGTASATSSIAETQEIMQQLLMKAQERGEMLNEMEIKAERLMKAAENYRKTCRQFRK